MKKLTLTLLLLSCLTFPDLISAKTDHSNVKYIGLGNSGMQITSVRIVDKVSTRDGVVRSENRHSNLVEVKIEGKTPSSGLAIINSGIFSAVFKYRKAYRLVTARAAGVKPEVAPGKIVEVLISAPDANLNSSSSKASENESYFLYFDIPREVKEFQIQIPALIKGSAIIK